jgi:hypothetical protein
MPSYHQMGHHSNNLIDLPEMSSFSGAIYSPINAVEADVAAQIVNTREVKANFEAILDPQMYVPATQRGKLREWGYFPKDVDTADLSSLAWWKALNVALSRAAQKVGADALCSPIIIPKAFDDKFYVRCVEICDSLGESLADGKPRVIQTAPCGLAGLCEGDRALEVASIISKTSAERVYLIFVATTEPRREMVECDELLAAMRMIRALEQSGIRVLVGFCSSDVVMWKAAGATSCASGKFFNLRRFTRERFEEPSGTGGGQLPYWFEEGLMAFLREPDLIRLRKLQLIGATSLANPFCMEILHGFDDAKVKQKPTPWLGTGWRQFLYWFADVERRLTTGETTTEALLRTADENWAKVEAAKVLMDERHNNGKWVRPWLNTLNDFGV